MRAGDRARVEVDRPAAEEPMVDLVTAQELVHLADRVELRFCPLGRTVSAGLDHDSELASPITIVR